MEKIRLLIVDDHPIIGEGLGMILNLDPDLVVLGTAPDGKAGLELLGKLNPEVVVLDLGMPDLSGVEAIRLYREARPETAIVIFSAHTEEKFVYQSLQAGAMAYVIKGSSPEELKQAIRLVKKGEFWISPRFSHSIVQNYLRSLEQEDPQRSAFESLSDREKQVFQLMVNGCDTDEIGDLLCISVNTVAKHRISLMKKLEVKNVVEMTKLAIRQGLIEV